MPRPSRRRLQAPSEELELIPKEWIPREWIPREWILRVFSTLGSPCPPWLLPRGAATAGPLSLQPAPPARPPRRHRRGTRRSPSASRGPAQPARPLRRGAPGMPGAPAPRRRLPPSAASPRRGRDANPIPPPAQLTLSSPRVDSLSNKGSPGAWMVTDLSPRLPSRLFERCRSRRSLEGKRGEQGGCTGVAAPIGARGPPPPTLGHAPIPHLCLRELRECPDL